ncbi:MAG: CehA/McbA family metallohydrolase [Planctomycetia bacterium]|nr:CehA/McbA family metallohydrolase [Planctomycetia bacterium]
MRLATAAAVILVLGVGPAVRAADEPALPIVETVERQPLFSQVERLVEALEFLGSPLRAADRDALEAARKDPDAGKAVAAVQKVLDPYCLLGVELSADKKWSTRAGVAKKALVEQGWTQFLVKVHNPTELTDVLRAASPNALRLAGSPAADVPQRWLDLQMFDRQPLTPRLTGLNLEYRIIQVYSRDAGKREASLALEHVVPGGNRRGDAAPNRKKDAAARPGADVVVAAAPVKVAFECAASHDVTFRVVDESGKPATAAFTIRDPQGRVYPSQAKRLAPDFAFHAQIYRSDRETVRLPAGTYTISCLRGPESIPETKTLTVGDQPAVFSYDVKRWVDPTLLGWYSGDHHIHAAGCAHYTNPSEGVHADDMIRHCMGEDLKVGCNLTWGPCFDYQLKFFTGKDDRVSQFPYLLRYDIEVSGFGSHRTGHLCLLRLTEQNYPGGDSNKHWPTLGLNTLKWAKKQGAITGPAHSGSGLAPTQERVAGPDGPNNLPNYAIPQYSGIGANEYIVDITHDVPGPDGTPIPAIDFISTMDTDRQQEFNMWYHTLNCGFRVRASGETDFPCISGQRVGMGRVYVKVKGRLNYEDWCEGIREGRSYVSDGTSHLMEFTAHPVDRPKQLVPVGMEGSDLKLDKGETIRLSAKVAARLDGKTVPVEVIVNAYPVAKKEIVADGTLHEVSFDVPIERSSWVALRLFPAAHTNPVFVTVGDKPIRASKRSAEWCLRGVDQCWKQKQQFYDAAEMKEAEVAYEHARTVFRRIVSESDVP